jgi:hypothetical protein
LRFTHIFPGFERDQKRSETTQIESNLPEVFDCFPKITRQFTFILAGSPMDDFFDGSRTDGRVSNQAAVVFDGVAFMVLGRETIAAGFASKSRGQSIFAGELSGWTRCVLSAQFDPRHFSVLLSRRSSFRGRLRLSMVRRFPIMKAFSFRWRKEANIWLLMVTFCRVLIA